MKGTKVWEEGKSQMSANTDQSRALAQNEY